MDGPNTVRTRVGYAPIVAGSFRGKLRFLGRDYDLVDNGRGQIFVNAKWTFLVGLWASLRGKNDDWRPFFGEINYQTGEIVLPLWCSSSYVYDAEADGESV